jgi:hypothetical protein
VKAKEKYSSLNPYHCLQDLTIRKPDSPLLYSSLIFERRRIRACGKDLRGEISGANFEPHSVYTARSQSVFGVVKQPLR